MRRGLGQRLQELVVQHFKLAHRAVRAVKDDGAVLRANGALGVFVQGHQVANAVLHLLQKRRMGAFVAVVKVVDLGQGELLFAVLGVVKNIELAHKVAALAAPGGQERVGVGVHVLQRHVVQRLGFAQGLAPAQRAQQFAPVHDVAPVVAAGVGNGQDHLAVRRQRGQRLQGGRRHLAHAKGGHALGHRLL